MLVLPKNHLPPASRQHGVALMLLLLLVSVGALAVFVSGLNRATLQLERDRITAAALAQAKEALIGWSVARGGTLIQRPGELPCPDTDAPGAFGYGDEEGSCSPGAIGRLPWKTLGIEEVRDGYGEPLWYVIDGAFRRRWGLFPSTNQPINSDTRPSVQAYSPDATNLVTPSGAEAVAIVIAPGTVLGNQVRGTNSEKVARTNYLESAMPPVIPVARNNVTVNGPFIQGEIKDLQGNVVLNDRLAIITARDLMPLIEKRVAKELKAILQNYYDANAYYPYPAKYDSTDCLDVGNMAYSTACSSDSNICRGRLPDTALPVGWSGGYALPGWFFFNLWGQVIYYAVGTSHLNSIPVGCSPTLTVNGVPGVRALFFMTGTPLGSIVRSKGWPLPATNQSTSISDYVEDTMNQSGWTGTAPLADQYCTPGGTNCLPSPAAIVNDRLIMLP